MKTTMNILLRALSFCIFFALFYSFSACEANKEYIDKSPQNGIVIERISLKDALAKSNHKLNEAVNKLRNIKLENNTSFASRIVYDSISNSYFDDEKGLHITKDTKESYTFAIIKSDPNAKIENICFNEKLDGSYDVYLVKYDYTKQQYESMTSQQLELIEPELVAIIKDGQAVTNLLRVYCIEVVAFVSIEAAPIDEGELTGNFGNQGGNGYWVTLASNCSFSTTINTNGGAGGPTTPLGNNGNNGNNGNSGNNGNDTISNNGGNNPPVNNEEIITGTVINDPISILNDTDAYKFNVFLNALRITDLASHDYLIQNSEIKNQILNYLILYAFSDESKAFAKELIVLAKDEPNQEDVSKLFNLTLLIENSGDTLFTDEFELSLDPYVDLDVANPPGDITFYLGVKVYLDYKKLRQLNPEWSRTKCLYHASKEIIHLSLDSFGLVPVFGEPADFINGVLYTIEGDGLNATLSFASTVPILGWATAGVKYSLKIVNVANDINTKVKLVWKVLPNNVIYFGSVSHCRTTLRKILGLAVGDARKAHHIIPLNKQTKEIVQKASKSGSAFHMNEALNGIPLSSAVHNGSHANYDNVIQTKFDVFNADNPNATPDQCYTFLTTLIQQIRVWIANNPNTPINNIVLP